MHAKNADTHIPTRLSPIQLKHLFNRRSSSATHAPSLLGQVSPLYSLIADMVMARARARARAQARARVLVMIVALSLYWPHFIAV